MKVHVGDVGQAPPKAFICAFDTICTIKAGALVVPVSLLGGPLTSVVLAVIVEPVKLTLLVAAAFSALCEEDKLPTTYTVRVAPCANPIAGLVLPSE